MIRTRFAPSPTGFIHLGNIRSALFPWAFARRHGGTFILRIEDTDTERSTPEATQAIVDAMAWLGLDYDEGPYYQMQRMERYRAVVADMLARGLAYRCYMPSAELEALREQQMVRGEKPRYDGRWRPERAQAAGLVPPSGVAPVIRFRNPEEGSVAWRDGVKGEITIGNAELDDLVIARPDGTPTYNFCVVVDDIDMRITHVIRGDDHVNNTPRQINIMRALGATPPVYAHLPTVLTPTGEKLSKRHGARGVLQYRDDGYLPEAVVNYLARLGWSHGDDEIFTAAQLLEWFDLDGLSSSPGRFDPDKLRWVNQEHMKRMAPDGPRRAAASLPRAGGTRSCRGTAPRGGGGAAARPNGDAGGDGAGGRLLLPDAAGRAGAARAAPDRGDAPGACGAPRIACGRGLDEGRDRRAAQGHGSAARAEAAPGHDGVAGGRRRDPADACDRRRAGAGGTRPRARPHRRRTGGAGLRA